MASTNGHAKPHGEVERAPLEFFLAQHWHLLPMLEAQQIQAPTAHPQHARVARNADARAVVARVLFTRALQPHVVACNDVLGDDPRATADA